MAEFLNHSVNAPLADAIGAILLMGMALLSWREFRSIRGPIKRRKAHKREDHPGPWNE